MNPEDHFGRSIYFLSQISKLFYLNVHDLADFMMLVSRFVFLC